MTRRPRADLATVRPLLATLAAAALPIAGVAALGTWGTPLADWITTASAWQIIPLVLGAGAILCGLALLPTHAVSLAAGFALGAIWGPAVAWLAVGLGAGVGFTGGRLFAGRELADRLAASQRWGAVYAALVAASASRTTGLIALLRLSPLAPFAATNVALAAIRVPLLLYLMGSLVGLAPRVVVVALFGAGLAQLDWTSPQAPLLLALGGLATLATLIVAGHAAAGAVRRVTAEADAARATPRVPHAQRQV